MISGVRLGRLGQAMSRGPCRSPDGRLGRYISVTGAPALKVTCPVRLVAEYTADSSQHTFFSEFISSSTCSSRSFPRHSSRPNTGASVVRTAGSPTVFSATSVERGMQGSSQAQSLKISSRFAGSCSALRNQSSQAQVIHYILHLLDIVFQCIISASQHIILEVQ
jgi:hypothetical protein